MKIEQQVCTLEQAKILQDLGIEYPDSELVYVDFSTASGQEAVLCRFASEAEIEHNDWIWVLKGKYSKEIQSELDEGSLNANGGIYPAFTVAELNQMLHDGCSSERKKYKDKYIWICEYGNADIYSEADTQAKSLAIMLISCLEEKITTPEEVNKRLQQ